MRTVIRRQWDDLWNTIDVLALPTTPTVAPKLEEKKLIIGGREEDVRLATTRLVRAFNYTGDPALSMPCGTNSLGLPVGLQLVAAPYSDARLLQIAKTLEAELGLNL
jgi:aspartyl-tRNA(Asn)/glutamyl-tRNA(Gln) amidotransferase subunit A